MDQELFNTSKISGDDLLLLIDASLHFWEDEDEKERREHHRETKENEKEATERQLLILLDMRSFVSYNQSHIATAINMCVPSTLLKRPSFCPKSVEAGISGPIGRELFSRRSGATVVLYDQGEEMSTILAKSFLALKKEALCQRVLILEGGFLKFQQEHPESLSGTKSKKGAFSSASCPALMPLVAPVTAPPALSFTLAPPPSSSSTSFPAAAAAPPPSLKAPNPSSKEEPIVPITDYLFLSGSLVASDYQTLRENRIRYIINSAEELENCFSDCGEFLYTRLNLQDHPSQHMCFVKVFENAFAIIEEAKRTGSRALVHCRGGRSRSATIVIAYLMKTFRLSFQQAYEYVQARNPKISPNLGFVGQLIRYETYLKSGEARISPKVSPRTSPKVSPKVVSPRACREESPLSLCSSPSSHLRPRGSPYHFHLLSSSSSASSSSASPSAQELRLERVISFDHLWPQSPPLSSQS